MRCKAKENLDSSLRRNDDKEEESASSRGSLSWVLYPVSHASEVSFNVSHYEGAPAAIIVRDFAGISIHARAAQSSFDPHGPVSLRLTVISRFSRLF
jgi:hypothetical protein